LILIFARLLTADFSTLDESMRRLVALTALILLPGCTPAQTDPPAPAAATLLSRIAFGSCNRETLPQPLWPLIARKDPQLWIWLGDNIYGDTDDMRLMRAKYAQQLSHPSYRALRLQVPIIGTWDDHDFGLNNGGREFAARAASQQALLDFLDEPADSPRRGQAGVYASYAYGPPGRRVKVILLDARYHRDARGSDGTVLGEAQWQWLERELRASDAQIHIIGSGIQVIAEDHRFEKWSEFPRERARLFALIRELRVPGVIFLSGDRHIAELSRLDEQVVGYPLYDLTSSGLTHTWSGQHEGEYNRHRVGELVVALNYGTLAIDWSAADPLISMRVYDERDAVRIEQQVRLSELR
jgi:alkaline phosphatase D